MARLVLLDEEGGKAAVWELGNSPLAVGRDVSADVIVQDATLSRRHFLVMRHGKHFLLKDLNSQNGTWVDGRRADQAELHDHDCILAGRTLFLFSEAALE
jgi:two-component system, NtrC family, sensor kinase